MPLRERFLLLLQLLADVDSAGDGRQGPRCHQHTRDSRLQLRLRWVCPRLSMYVLSMPASAKDVSTLTMS